MEALSQDFPQHVHNASGQVIPNRTDNRFAVLSDYGKETEESQSIVSSGIAKPGISQHAHENSLSSFHHVLQDDPLEALIEIHLLLRVSSIWRGYLSKTVIFMRFRNWIHCVRP
jgi:hypothetical protein